MRMTVTDQAARIRSPLIGNWGSSVRSNDIYVEVHHALPRNEGSPRTCSVCAMADRAGKTVVDMTSVPAETGIADDVCQIVALGA